MLTRDPSGYCEAHRDMARGYDTMRPPATERGYGHAWRKVRELVLKAFGIPKSEWPLWDIDHEPPYNAAIEPDHLKYKLTPRRHAEHSAKTAARDGGFGNRKGVG